ncbi:MAG TPA: ATP-grasp fold amidoligase family protein [Clostridia bacterium]|nr:ATP-grasp fold amidoligase family protein [Clostridia bacterium]
MLTAKEIFIECYRRVLGFLPDKLYLKLMYYFKTGKKLNLKNPQTYNEKIQWLKLHDRNPLYATLVDKYAVKKYVADTIGEEYVIPLLGVWEKSEDIDFDKLPDEFILKTTHDSGTHVICKDKKSFDYDEAQHILNHRLKQNYYKFFREWAYKDVKPRIIAEELLQTADNTLPVDYKFFCFDGKADCVMVCVGRGTGKTRFYFFDKDWNLLRLNPAGIAAAEDFTLPKPAKINEMFDLAEKLSQGIPFVRIDLYCENDKIYFGEFTFYPSAGFDKNLLPETDLLLGSKINLRSSR